MVRWFFCVVFNRFIMWIHGNFPDKSIDDRLFDWLITWLIDYLIDWLVNWLIDGLIDWLIDWLMDWLITWLIDWLTDGLIDWLMDWLIDWWIDWLIGWQLEADFILSVVDWQFTRCFILFSLNMNMKFVCRDRMFGTFEPEHTDEDVVYGIISPVSSFNGLWVQFNYYISAIARLSECKTLDHKIKSLIMGPGWQARWLFKLTVRKMEDVKFYCCMWLVNGHSIDWLIDWLLYVFLIFSLTNLSFDWWLILISTFFACLMDYTARHETSRQSGGSSRHRKSGADLRRVHPPVENRLRCRPFHRAGPIFQPHIRALPKLGFGHHMDDLLGHHDHTGEYRVGVGRPTVDSSSGISPLWPCWFIDVQSCEFGNRRDDRASSETVLRAVGVAVDRLFGPATRRKESPGSIVPSLFEPLTDLFSIIHKGFFISRTDFCHLIFLLPLWFFRPGISPEKFGVFRKQFVTAYTRWSDLFSHFFYGFTFQNSNL